MITVLLFARLQDSIGQGQLTYPIAPITLKELLKNLSEQYPQGTFSGVMASVNQRYAEPDDVIQSGDVVALLPAIGGG